MFVYMNHYIFVNKRTKSWAIGLEIASKLVREEPNAQVTVVSIGSFPRNYQIVSLSRVNTQRRILSRSRLCFQRMHWRVKCLDLSLLSNAYINAKIQSRGNKWDEESHVVRAHFAARHASSNTSPNFCKRRHLFRANLVKESVQACVRKLIGKFDPKSSTVWVFNGRELLEASILEVAINRGVRTRIFERGSVPSKYSTFFHSPHYNNEWWTKIQEFHKYKQSRDCQLDSKAIESYIARKITGDDPYEGRKWNHLFNNSLKPEDLVQGEYICFFSVSTAEFSPIPSFESLGGYHSQFEALEDLVRVARDRSFKVVIRRHPNSIDRQGIDREEQLWRRFIDDSHVVYVGPRNKINSYELAARAIASFTWRSTIGFDLLARGLPTFAMGPAKWGFETDLQAFNLNQIIEKLDCPIISPAANDAIHAYAHYFSCFGIPMQEFEFVERWGFKTKVGGVKKSFLF